MLLVVVFLLVLQFAAPVSALAQDTSQASSSEHRVFTEAALPIPAGWSITGRSPPSSRIELLVGVRQTGLSDLEQLLLAVSDPSSPRYGQHHSSQQVSSITAANTSQCC